MRDTLSFAWLPITRHRLRFLLAVTAIAVAVLVLAGCGHRAAQKPASTPAAPKAALPLPEWAPKNPSPEFLRAARMLKPMPAELEWLSARGVPSESEKSLAAKRMMLVWPAAYEFFGALSDEQIAQFLRVRELEAPPTGSRTGSMRVRGHEVVMPAKMLTTKQRAALDRFFDAARRSGQDVLLWLYEAGAKRDLSNVKVGFTTAGATGRSKENLSSRNEDGRIVGVLFYVAPATRMTCETFAQM
jgi:hypothetical protein